VTTSPTILAALRAAEEALRKLRRIAKPAREEWLNTEGYEYTLATYAEAEKAKSLLAAAIKETEAAQAVEGDESTMQKSEPNPEWEAIADAAHAAIIAKCGIEPEATLNMLVRYKSDAEPANEFGQITFSRSMLDSATDALQRLLNERTTLKEEVNTLQTKLALELAAQSPPPKPTRLADDLTSKVDRYRTGRRVMTTKELLDKWIGHDAALKVRKVGGRYGGPGEIRDVIMHSDDELYISVVVAHRIEGGYGEFLHIYTPPQLEWE